MIKKIICLLMVVMLVMSIPLQAVAVNEIKYNFSVASIDDVSDIHKCVLVDTIGKYEVRKVSSFAMQKINSIEDDKETIIAELFNNIGISFFEESSMQQHLTEDLDAIKNISVNTCYTKIDKNGTITFMDKDTCLNEIAELNRGKTSNVTRGSGIISDGNEDTSDNGYMKSAIAYFYNGNGYYILVGQWEWLIEPAITRKDAFSLYSTNMIWGNSGENNYEKVTSYHSYMTQNGQVIQNKKITNSTQADPSIESDGVFYTWNLPTSSSSASHANVYTDYMCQLWATARVEDYDDYTQQLSVYSRYVHKKVSLAVTYALSAAKKGVAIGASGSSSTAESKAYPHYFSWDYKDDAIANGEY